MAGGSRFGRLGGANVTRQMWLKCVPVVKKQGFTVFSFILILAPFELLFWSAFQLSWRVCLPLGLSWVPLWLPCWIPGASPGAHGDTPGSSWGARGVTRCIWGHIFIDYVGVLRYFVGVLRPWWLPLGFIGRQVLHVPNGPHQIMGVQDSMEDFLKLHHLPKHYAS